ncbi:hypothetical protein VIBNISO65_1270021 [Vibrio nigripulchritudo SO65]|nr:hypothetical protein VIBNIPon4_230022 [Vibrio nigripulchritudo POn4]CCN75067.1 hypothetical protein VIBNISO65_1270021 [Vibrio nigripulchritudo SO65]
MPTLQPSRCITPQALKITANQKCHVLAIGLKLLLFDLG